MTAVLYIKQSLIILVLILLSFPGNLYGDDAIFLRDNPGSRITHIQKVKNNVIVNYSDVSRSLFSFNTKTDAASFLHRFDGQVEEFRVFDLLGEVAGRVVFSGSSPASSHDLWCANRDLSDMRAIADIGSLDNNITPILHPTVHNNLLYFVADDGRHGYELWRTDGTSTGTFMLGDINPSSVKIGASIRPASLGGILLFRATSTEGPGELWRTDGTISGTTQLLVPDMNIESAHGGFVRLGDIVIFPASSSETGIELWRTDGTKEGTRIVADANPGPASLLPHDLVPYQGTIVFRGRDDLHGEEVWVTDGTSVGTHMLHDIVPGPASSSPSPFIVSHNRVFFPAFTARQGRELWVSDGTQAGLQLVIDLNPGPENGDPYQITSFAKGVLFSGAHPRYGEELWYAIGDPAVAQLVKDIRPGPESSEPYHITVVEGVAFFSADDGVHGAELWESDGTAQNTRLVSDIVPPPAISPRPDTRLLAVDTQRLFLLARGGTRGAFQVHIVEGASNIAQSVFEEPAIMNVQDVIGCWPAYDRAFLAIRNNGVIQLWILDIPEKDATLLTSLGNDAVVDANSASYNEENGFFFSLFKADFGTELWHVPNGSIEASLVTDIYHGKPSASPGGLVNLHDSTYFSADDGVHGRELWRLTKDNVQLVQDIYPGDNSSEPRELCAGDDQLYFVADDGSYGPEVWRFDIGTDVCERITDVNPMQESRAFAPRSLVALDRSVVFSAHDGVHGYELWAAGDSMGSGKLLRDLYIGSSSSHPEELTRVNSRVFFRANTQTKGEELFATDGTVEGTYLVHDLALGRSSGLPSFLRASGNKLFFVSYADETGRLTELPSLWTSDGFETRRIGNWDENSRHCLTMAPFNDGVAIETQIRQTSRELWIVDRANGALRRVELDLPFVAEPVVNE